MSASIPSWQPSASLKQLQQRARIVAAIRQFFAERHVMEVDTPLLASHGVTDLHLHNFVVHPTPPGPEGPLYLQTSPEYAMKRLLAAGSGCIYQFARAFRDQELGTWHQPEFTMLEWYRIGFDHHQLMDEVMLLLQQAVGIGTENILKASYGQLWQQHLQLNPHTVTIEELQACGARHDLAISAVDDLSTTDWCELLFDRCIVPELAAMPIVCVYDYPSDQAALAALRAEGDETVAERFEVYLYGIECGNGFHELTDPGEQAQRFAKDNALRQSKGLPVREPDSYLLAALQQGMPPCAGVALGLERVLAAAWQLPGITATQAFSFI